MPEMARNSVDFPDPDGPVSNTFSPRANVRSLADTM
jgi:hypothetical protein